MVTLTSLWLPVLISAVLVFFASFVMHMVLRYHRTDFAKVPAEEEVMAALERSGVGPGDYMFPHGEGPEAMRDATFVAKLERGPVAVMTVIPSGRPDMKAQLGQWFAYCVVVSIFAGYVAARAVAPGGEYLEVFRFAGTTAFAAYALGLWQNSIWLRRKWSTTLKQTFDGLVFALLTAGTFGWLWPA